MKTLGIVRKIDDLGRIVIPKEIRKLNDWEPGTPMEMFSTENGLLIRSYQPNVEKQQLLGDLHEVLKSTNNAAVSTIIDRAIEFVKKQ